ncbi:type IV pilus twitching motility protein PilT [Glaciihabitans sp. UYNi722]|uniref:type IV pilus twitching motility protein PilT n=1 Tax=Glaciihabitans sp. UYNi722 TaxID=3156344 RepID=UPI0033944A84
MNQEWPIYEIPMADDRSVADAMSAAGTAPTTDEPMRRPRVRETEGQPWAVAAPPTPNSPPANLAPPEWEKPLNYPPPAYAADEMAAVAALIAASAVEEPEIAEPEMADLPAPHRFANPHTDGDLLSALDRVVEMRGSDLHVTVNATPMIRLHGGLQAVPGATVWNSDKIRAALHSIMSESQREIFETELELDFAYTLSADSRFRVNIYQQRGSIGAAFRLIPTEIKQLHELGVPETINRFARLARGLVLVTGPTGSGKSTTLAAVIDLVNRERADHIVTVEDPIEFLHENKRSLVNQREVGSDTHSFAAALKHVLRQDPDVILIGELRDLETISVALTAAETGHLVFATLHTQSAAQTIDRVIDVFPPHQQGQVRSQLAATLQGVVCQTLVKNAAGDGRVVATEVMVATPAIGNLIREGKTYQVPSAMQAGRELGMHTLDQHLAELVNGGLITHEAAMEKAQDLENLKQLIRREDGAASPTASASSTAQRSF